VACMVAMVSGVFGNPLMLILPRHGRPDAGQ